MQRIKKAYAENGDLKIIPEMPPLDGSENWEQGRGAYYELDNDPNNGDPLALDIDREQDNYFKNVISKNIKHWQENSYPNWFDDIEYPKNAIVKYSDGILYTSKVDNNTALPTDTNNWVNFEDFGSLNINALSDKATPDDTDNLALQETGGLLKKLSFANLKLWILSLFNPTLTGTVSFNSTTNNIELTNIITALGLEIGDVIQISGATDSKNNSEFTVEVITDDDNIIVNQAHANKGTAKNLATRVSDTSVTVKLLAKWYNAPIGLGQGWVDVTSSRIAGTNYLNSTNRPIQITINRTTTTATTYWTILSNNTIAAESYTANSVTSVATADIPKNSTYTTPTITGVSLRRWSELR